MRHIDNLNKTEHLTDDELVNELMKRETSNTAVDLPDPPDLFTKLVKDEKNKLS